jgi:hypothetical protein
MNKSETSPHWAGWIVMHLFRLILAILIVGITVFFMAASIAISIGKGK